MMMQHMRAIRTRIRRNQQQQQQQIVTTRKQHRKKRNKTTASDFERLTKKQNLSWFGHSARRDKETKHATHRDNLAPTQSIYCIDTFLANSHRPESIYFFSMPFFSSKKFFFCLHLNCKFTTKERVTHKQNRRRRSVWFRRTVSLFDDHDILWVTWEIEILRSLNSFRLRCSFWDFA